MYRISVHTYRENDIIAIKTMCVTEPSASKLLKDPVNFFEMMAELYKYIIYNFYSDYNNFTFIKESTSKPNSDVEKIVDRVYNDVIINELKFAMRKGMEDVYLVTRKSNNNKKRLIKGKKDNAQLLVGGATEKNEVRDKKSPSSTLKVSESSHSTPLSGNPFIF